jgi:hypothetical protein
VEAEEEEEEGAEVGREKMVDYHPKTILLLSLCRPRP